MANLRLDEKDGGAFADRGSYRLIAPGDPAHSRLVERINADKPSRRILPETLFAPTLILRPC